MSKDVGSQTNGQKAVLNLYAAFGVSLILSILPNMTAAGLSLVFFLGVLIGAYIVRSKFEDHSFAENHATFLIRTLWISAFLSLITTGIATFYMMGGIEYRVFQPCADDLAGKGVAWIESAGMMDVYAIIEPCVKPFLNLNQTLLINSALIAGAPLILYMAYRMVKGLSRAIKGYRLSDAKTWF